LKKWQGGWSFDIIGLHAYGCVLLRVGAADGMECVAGGTQKPEKVCGKGCS
jgi:hypothetical protein